MKSSLASHSAVILKKYKAACDQCHNSKIRCPGGGPPCGRCTEGGHKCHYSFAARIGKPPGSKNRKTLERLHRAKMHHLETSPAGSARNDSINQISSNGDNTGNQVWAAGSGEGNGENTESSVQILDIQGVQPMSPLVDSLEPLDMPQSPTYPPEGVIQRHSRPYLDNSDEQAMDISEVLMPTFESMSKEDLQMPWADIADDSWSVGSLAFHLPASAEYSTSLGRRIPINTL